MFWFSFPDENKTAGLAKRKKRTKVVKNAGGLGVSDGWSYIWTLSDDCRPSSWGLFLPLLGNWHTGIEIDSFWEKCGERNRGTQDLKSQQLKKSNQCKWIFGLNQRSSIAAMDKVRHKDLTKVLFGQTGLTAEPKWPRMSHEPCQFDVQVEHK